jgi:hypothetical protein
MAPHTAPATEWPVSPTAARPTPAAATVAVSGFGIFPVRRSMAAAEPEAAATAARTTTSDAGSGNGLPQHRVDRLAHSLNGSDGHESDERHEHRVFQKVLPLIGADQPIHEHHHTIHVRHSQFLGSEPSKQQHARDADMRDDPGAKTAF